MKKSIKHSVKHSVSKAREANELLAFMWKSKMWFLIPFIVILILFAAVFVFAQATGIAPFIYTLF